MKTIIYTLVLMMGSFIYGQEHAVITVNVNNVTNDEGKIYFGLYNTKDGFLKMPFKAAGSSIKEGTASVTFEDIAPGEYAITCFHDTNGNQRMDFETNGMPKEDYGVSNNEMLMGPPTWESAKFTMTDAPPEMEIRL